MKKLTFSESVIHRYYAKRDNCGDEYIALRGKKSLRNGGLDHIYLINRETVGLWITSKQINRTIKKFQSKVPDLKIEQLGDGEAVLSVPLNNLDALCQAAGARTRPHLTDEQKKLLAERGKPFRFSKRDAKEKQKTA